MHAYLNFETILKHAHIYFGLSRYRAMVCYFKGVGFEESTLKFSDSGKSTSHEVCTNDNEFEVLKLTYNAGAILNY